MTDPHEWEIHQVVERRDRPLLRETPRGHQPAQDRCNLKVD